MAFDPKKFYRRLDELLQEIDLGSGSPDFFVWLMREILERFGDQLSISNGRLYVEERQGYRIERQVLSLDQGIEGLLLPADYPPIVQVRDSGLCVFDEEDTFQDLDIESRLGGQESVAILVKSEPRRILAFGLTEGWDEERVELAMHTIRNAVNNRLAVVDLHLGLDQLQELQRALIPNRPPELPGHSIAARCIPYAPIGGDFYDFQLVGTDSVGLALGDASGHGLPAALVARDAVTGLRMAAQQDLKITATIRRLNNVIGLGALSSRFVSLFYGELESNGNLFYVNAGHQPGLVFSRDGVQTLEIGGSVLGPLEDAEFKRGFAHLDRGGTLVLLTDGVIERKSPSGELFGMERVLDAARPHVGKPAAEVLDAIVEAVEAHAEGLPATDDTSLVVVTREKAYRRDTRARLRPRDR